MNYIKKSKTVTWKNIVSFIIYCLPCLVALSFILYFYYERTQKVTEQLTGIAKSFQSHVINESVLDSLKLHSVSDTMVLKYTNPVDESTCEKPLDNADHLQKLQYFFCNQRTLGLLTRTLGSIDKRVGAIWFRNSTIIFLFSFLPFLLLGARLAFGDKVGLNEAGKSLDEAGRRKYAKRHVPMKFVVACVITIGWMYVVNPHGRGATTSEEYLNAVDVVSVSTLPVYVQPREISNTAAGFLGWYLFLILYFFRKLYYSDVVSARVYRFVFGKFLFTYGIALTFSAVLVNEAKPALFLIGFFSLSAVSILKQYGLKASNALTESKVNLSELPGISVWHVMRLEEEGVDSTATLANYDLEKLKLLPRVMQPLVDFWRGVAQLQTILGKEIYEKVKSFSQTAREFIIQVDKHYDDSKFIKHLEESSVKNPEEVVWLLQQTFKDISPLDKKKMN